MEMLWFWIVSVFSASPAVMRETSLPVFTMNAMEIGHA